MDKYLRKLFGLDGKIALVTGASSGLGVEFARTLASAGADVGLLARRVERLEQLADELRQLGVRAVPIRADLARADDRLRAMTELEQQLGPVDIMVNNAGIAPFGKAETQTLEQWEEGLTVNLTAVFHLCQLAARRMIPRAAQPDWQGGRIINIGSVMGDVASSIFPTVSYNASKGGVHQLTRQLAVEWARHRITVNAIAPAWFPTEMSHDPRHGGIPPKYRERMEHFTPMQRLGQPDELSSALLFLASPASTYVTGVILNVDGGWLAW